MSPPVGVTHRPLQSVLLLLGLVCTMSPFSTATNDPHVFSPKEGVTFSHIYKIDVAAGSSCKSEDLHTEGKTGPDSLKILFFNKKNIAQHVTPRDMAVGWGIWHQPVASILIANKSKYKIILFLH